MDIKTLSEIAVSIINNIHDTLPDADTKEGTFIRDVFVDPVAYEIQALYEQAKLIEIAQSVLTATGTDLDNLAMNFFVIRKGASRSTGKLRFYLGPQAPSVPLTIPIGTGAYTPATDAQPELFFETTESYDILPNSPNTYSFDSTINMYYVDIPAWSRDTGEIYNINAAEVSQLDTGVDSSIAGVTNPFGFSGGTDTEDDDSLALRISLAITGSNIGTKDGYASFIFKQNGVVDAAVVGAGDPLMTRDKGLGGMVDIHVRAESLEEYTESIKITSDYITDTTDKPGYSNITLMKQPVSNIVSLSGIRAGMQSTDPPINYIDGTNYQIEQGTNKYYYDLEWDFNSNANLPPQTQETLQQQASDIISTMLNSINYLYDLKYNINFSIVNPDTDNVQPQDANFLRGFYSDGLVYMLKTRNNATNPYVGGRYFVKNNGVICERHYVIPDFVLVKDTTDYGNSLSGKDSISWIPTSTGAKRPLENEVITITYNFNSIISDLQTQIEDKRVLTADVLVKQARRVGIEIKVEAVLSSGYVDTDVKTSIINQITNYINNLKQLGNSVDRSDVISAVRIVDGVDAVNVDTIYLARTNQNPEKQISIKGFEYFEIDRIVVTILPTGTVV